MHQSVLNFWFDECEPQQWFTQDASFDELIRARFERLLLQAQAGELFQWRTSAHGRLAEIIMLDQFSRNLYRDTPQAFAQDAMALALAQEAVAQGALNTLEKVEQRNFLLMPFMHSESQLIHQWAEPVFKQYACDNTYQFELRHKVIIDRFGRYPHRNAVLQRQSSEEELEFLKQPNSSF